MAKEKGTGREAAGNSLPKSKTRASGGTTSSFECKGGKLVKCCLYAGVQGQRPRPACASSGRAAQFSSCRHASPLRSSAWALIVEQVCTSMYAVREPATRVGAGGVRSWLSKFLCVRGLCSGRLTRGTTGQVEDTWSVWRVRLGRRWACASSMSCCFIFFSHGESGIVGLYVDAPMSKY